MSTPFSNFNVRVSDIPLSILFNNEINEIKKEEYIYKKKPKPINFQTLKCNNKDPYDYIRYEIEEDNRVIEKKYKRPDPNFEVEFIPNLFSKVEKKEIAPRRSIFASQVMNKYNSFYSKYDSVYDLHSEVSSDSGSRRGSKGPAKKSKSKPKFLKNQSSFFKKGTVVAGPPKLSKDNKQKTFHVPKVRKQSIVGHRKSITGRGSLVG